MTKTIGIPGWSLDTTDFGVTKPYIEYFSQFGQVEILTPRKGVVPYKLDLLVLPGGLDMYSLSYGEAPSVYASNIDTFKQYFYDINLPQYIANKTPIFGICLGFQQLCAEYGLPLAQHCTDIPRSPERTTRVEYLKVNSELLPFKFELSPRKLKEEFSTSNIKPKTTPFAYPVNSLHHQSVYTEKNDNLNIIAVSEYGNVEAVLHKTLKIGAVQWHPEEINDRLANELVNYLLN